MTLRLAASAEEIAMAARLRPSVRPATAASLLDCDRSQVYKLIKSQELETHGLGKRGVRIYVDSIEGYRERRAGVAPKLLAKRPKKLGAEHHEACAHLRALGLL